MGEAADGTGRPPAGQFGGGSDVLGYGACGPGGGRPPCAICADGSEHRRCLVHLTHGVAVWLCQTHGSESFMREDEGTLFADRLAGMWIATGTLTTRRAAAIRTHVRQVTSAGVERERPGSYSWPMLRREAEERFAQGHDPRQVIQELRSRHAAGAARPPSVRTMRRWYTQARWLAAPGPKPSRRDGPPRRTRISTAYAFIPYPLARHLRWDYLRPASFDP